jgi:tetratricopeptide (TPR) repeat protein
MLPKEKHLIPRHRSAPISKSIVVLLTITMLGVFAAGRYYLLSSLAAGGAAIIATAIITIIWVFRHQRRMISQYAILNETAALIGSGKDAQAAKILDRLIPTITDLPEMHILALQNRAAAYVHQGDSARALSLLAAVYNSEWLQDKLQASHMNYPILLVTIITCYALMDDLDEAERWQNEAHQVTPESRAGLLVPIDCLIAVRRGRYEVAVRDAEKGWCDAEGSYPASNIKALRLLCAFALRQLPPDPVREEQARDFLGGARPFQPGQFDFMAGDWPAFRKFLGENGFSAPALKDAPLAKAAK